MKKLLILSVSLITLQTFAQNRLEVFSNIVGSTWISEGKQLGGHDGKTVKEFEWGLDKRIIKVKTFTTDPKTLEFGLRNEGVRTFNTQTNQIEFYEFDKLGGVSQGVVKIEDQNIYYEYSYGEMLLRDSWIFISKDEYAYKVCSIVNNKCDQVFHQGIFKRKK